jgi:hypothetical protein
MINVWEGMSHQIDDLKSMISDRSILGEYVCRYFNEYIFNGVFSDSKLEIEDSHNIKYGGIIKSSNLTKAICEYLIKLLNENKKVTVILPVRFAKPSDPVVKRMDLPIFYCGNEVYSYATKEHVDNMYNTVIHSSNTGLDIFLSCNDFSIENRSNVDTDFLKAISSEVTKFLCEAFDGEAALLFSK